jgi:hypothetical protein
MSSLVRNRIGAHIDATASRSIAILVGMPLANRLKDRTRLDLSVATAGEQERGGIAVRQGGGPCFFAGVGCREGKLQVRRQRS